MPELVAIHYAVVFPDAKLYLSKGVIPPMSIATKLYVDITGREGDKGRDKRRNNLVSE
jgi:hypothetical protein